MQDSEVPWLKPCLDGPFDPALGQTGDAAQANEIGPLHNVALLHEDVLLRSNWFGVAIRYQFATNHFRPIEERDEENNQRNTLRDSSINLP